jgi:hypothetical protein
LIPLHFNSFIRNVYKKPGEGHTVPDPKFYNSSLPACPSPAHARISATPFRSIAYFITRGHPRGGVSPGGTAKLFPIPRASRDESWLSIHPARRGTRRLEHGPRTTGPWTTGHSPLVPRYRCAATRKVPESRQLLSVRRWQETYPLQSVSNVLRADIGYGKPQRRPGSKSIPARRTGIALARRPGSNVLRCSSNVDLTAGWSG